MIQREIRRVRICELEEARQMIADGTFDLFLERIRKRWFPSEMTRVQRVVATRRSHEFHGPAFKDTITISDLRSPIIMLEIGDDKALILKSERADLLSRGNEHWHDGQVFPNDESIFKLIHRAVCQEEGRVRTPISFGEF